MRSLTLKFHFINIGTVNLGYIGYVYFGFPIHWKHFLLWTVNIHWNFVPYTGFRINRTYSGQKSWNIVTFTIFRIYRMKDSTRSDPIFMAYCISFTLFCDFTLTRLPGVTTKHLFITGLPPYGPCFSNVLHWRKKNGLYSRNSSALFVTSYPFHVTGSGNGGRVKNMQLWHSTPRI